jgi:N-acetylmuramic acid 6-phosphate etherase
MSDASNRRSDEFLRVSSQFKLGALVTESSHPVTATLSEVARQDVVAALDLLFQVDLDVIATYRRFVESGRASTIAATVLEAVRSGGRIFFTGCGSTGRLSIQLVSIWRDFWQQQGRLDLVDRAFSVMAGGDFALIKSVEGFEDFAAFGSRQIGDLGVKRGDVVFAITEGGETSFVIGTAWQGVAVGANVFFVYNNPDAILCEHVERSREIIQDSRIEKINLTTGPMAITGSTRMQATSIQLCVLLTVLEMVVRESIGGLPAAAVPAEFLEKLVATHAALRSKPVLESLAQLVTLEEGVYRNGGKNNYFANRLGIDVLTDTTERSPTYCTPPFRKWDDAAATESWSFLFVPYPDSARAWSHILKRTPRCVEWTESELKELVGEERLARTAETIRRIRCEELMRFRIGLDGLACRPLHAGDSAIAIVHEGDRDALALPHGFFHQQLAVARAAGAGTGWIHFGSDALADVGGGIGVRVPVDRGSFLLDGVTRVGVKLLLNALSTCTMVRLGRVMGNYMIWVVASNLKLIDRATRYIQKLTGLEYEAANRLLFEAVEYVEPRMRADRAHPPVVGLSVMRHRHGLTNEEAERRLLMELG